MTNSAILRFPASRFPVLSKGYQFRHFRPDNSLQGWTRQSPHPLRTGAAKRPKAKLSQKRNPGTLRRGPQRLVQRRQWKPPPMCNLQIGRVIKRKLMPPRKPENRVLIGLFVDFDWKRAQNTQKCSRFCGGDALSSFVDHEEISKLIPPQGGYKCAFRIFRICNPAIENSRCQWIRLVAQGPNSRNRSVQDKSHYSRPSSRADKISSRLSRPIF